MSARPVTDESVTLQEVALTLSTLSDSDLSQIKHLAMIRSYGLTLMGWQDLVNEAVSRLLSGARRWPRTVPFVAFMAQTMRSIASEEWEEIERGTIVREADFATSADADVPHLAELGAAPVDVEAHALALVALQKIQAHFSADPEVLAVLQGLALGSTPAEIQRQVNMTPTAYATAQRRLRRYVASANGQGDWNAPIQ